MSTFDPDISRRYFNLAFWIWREGLNLPNVGCVHQSVEHTSEVIPTVSPCSAITLFTICSDGRIGELSSDMCLNR